MICTAELAIIPSLISGYAISKESLLMMVFCGTCHCVRDKEIPIQYNSYLRYKSALLITEEAGKLTVSYGSHCVVLICRQHFIHDD